MNKGKFIKNLTIVLTFIFLYAPIIVLVIYSFNKSKMNVVFTGFTFDWYKTLMHNTDLLEAFRNTLIIAGVSTVVSTIIGTISALGLYKYNFPLKKLINGLIYIPLLGSIPFNPEIPLPRIIFIIIVSALSFLLCAIAILFELVFSKISLKNSYLTFLPASSVPILLVLASFFTSILFE